MKGGSKYVFLVSFINFWLKQISPYKKVWVRIGCFCCQHMASWIIWSLYVIDTGMREMKYALPSFTPTKVKPRPVNIRIISKVCPYLGQLWEHPDFNQWRNSPIFEQNLFLIEKETEKVIFDPGYFYNCWRSQDLILITGLKPLFSLQFIPWSCCLLPWKKDQKF